MNGQMLNGKPIRVAWVQRDPTIRRSGRGNVFIKGLPPKWTTADLFDFVDTQLLEEDGVTHIEDSIISCRIGVRTDGSSKGYGYVQFDSLAHAERAIAQFNGLKVDEHDQPLDMSPYRRRQDRYADEADTWTNVIIFGLPPQWGVPSLTNVVKKAGFTAQNIAVAIDADGKSKGFGYANMMSNGDAVALIAALNGSTWSEEMDMVKAAPAPDAEAEAADPASSGAAAGGGISKTGPEGESKDGEDASASASRGGRRGPVRVQGGPAPDGSGFVLAA